MDVTHPIRDALLPFMRYLEAYQRPRIGVKPEDTIIMSVGERQLTLADFDRLASAFRHCGFDQLRDPGK